MAVDRRKFLGSGVAAAQDYYRGNTANSTKAAA